MIARILAIAGSDSGGGAGIQADIKTITMLGGHATTAITAITAQNTLGVLRAEMIAPAMVLAQMRAVHEDIGIDAIKIGMIGTAETVDLVAEVVHCYGVPIVFDPVMIASSGARLADDATIASFDRLARVSTLVTPNLPELAVLLGQDVIDADRIEAGAARYAAIVGVPVLAKGGHAAGGEITDRLALPDGAIHRWSDPRIETRHSHGTGCTLSSAIATGLGQGMPLVDAIDRARRYVRAALLAAPGFGDGHGPMGHALGRMMFGSEEGA